MSKNKSNQIEWLNAPTITPANKVGFVYNIAELNTGMIYIGIKKFWKVNKLKPLKGKKNKRHMVAETDWRDYNSSNKLLQDKIEKNPDNYKKIIVKLCDTVTDMKAQEAFMQLEYYISGNWDRLFNQMINLRLRIRK